MIRCITGTLFLGWIVLIIGCSPIHLPSMANYTLTSTTVFAEPVPPRTGASLYIQLPVANPGYTSASMLYLSTPYKLSVFAQNQWVAPPALMLQPIVTQAVRARGHFKAVVNVPSSGEVTYRLELQLINLQQEFLTSTSKVRMSVQATLLNNANSHVIASQRFDALILATANNPYAGVLAANQAVTRIAERIATFCIIHTK